MRTKCWTRECPDWSPLCSVTRIAGGAVDLYFTQGMTIRKVVARLGYPSEGALVNWVRSDPRYERVSFVK